MKAAGNPTSVRTVSSSRWHFRQNAGSFVLWSAASGLSSGRMAWEPWHSRQPGDPTPSLPSAKPWADPRYWAATAS